MPPLSPSYLGRDILDDLKLTLEHRGNIRAGTGDSDVNVFLIPITTNRLEAAIAEIGRLRFENAKQQGMIFKLIERTAVLPPDLFDPAG